MPSGPDVEVHRRGGQLVICAGITLFGMPPSISPVALVDHRQQVSAHTHILLSQRHTPFFVNASRRTCAYPTRCEAGLLLAGAENDIPDSFLDKEVMLERHEQPLRAAHIVLKLSASCVRSVIACVHVVWCAHRERDLRFSHLPRR